MLLLPQLLVLASAEIRLFRTPSVQPLGATDAFRLTGLPTPPAGGRLIVLDAPRVFPSVPGSSTSSSYLPCLFAALAGFGCARLSAALLLTGSGLKPRFARAPQVKAIVCPSGEKVVALGDAVVVDIDNVPAESTGGVLLPSAHLDDQEDDIFAKPEPRVARVLSVGPDAVSAAGKPINVGEEVVVGPIEGRRIELEGLARNDSTVYVFRADEIWGTA